MVHLSIFRLFLLLFGFPFLLLILFLLSLIESLLRACPLCTVLYCIPLLMAYLSNTSFCFSWSGTYIVSGIVVGLFVTSLPNVRNILVDIEDRNGTAPLQWFFDGLYEVGQAAVPINMIILGCNLSASYMLLPAAQNKVNEEDDVDNDDHRDDKEDDGNDDDKNEGDGFFSKKVNILMVVGKMIIMPIIGFISTYVVATYVYTAPETIAGGLYLVLLIVFLTPTANNVMVMVELASSSSSSSAAASGSDNEGPTLKENMAMNIAYQYATSPILLSGTVTGAVLLATSLGTVTPS